MAKDIKLEYIIEEKCAEMKGLGINEPEFAFMHPTTYNQFANTFMSRNRFMVVGPEKPTKIKYFQCMYGKVELIQSFQVEEGDVKIMGRAIIEDN